MRAADGTASDYSPQTAGNKIHIRYKPVKEVLMKGLKFILFGIMFILIGGFILVAP